MLLEIKNLETTYRIAEGEVKAVNRVSFGLEEGENLGLVGESGCGKTTITRSILQLLPENGEITGGQVLFQGKDLTALNKEEIRKIRWKDISLIAQSAMNALDPVYRVGDQLVEAVYTHKKMGKKAAWNMAREAFRLVGIEPERLKDYPHQFSGGMKQRAVIAMALILDPALIIADEPTTALDVIVQAQILNKIIELEKKMKSSMILVTHDISVVAGTCQKIAVMYAGKLMEFGRVGDVLKLPFHPYTLGLKNAFPSIKGVKRELISIPGAPPDLLNPPGGCYFAPRCPFTTELCQNVEPELEEVAGGHLAACHNLNNIERMRQEAAKKENWLNSIEGRGDGDDSRSAYSAQG